MQKKSVAGKRKKRKESKRATWRKILATSLILAFIGVAILFSLNFWVVQSARKWIFDDPAILPTNAVGVVLGTSNRLRGGQPNPFFNNRMEAAAELFKLGRVRHLLVSGDNRTPGYNEPEKMRQALIALGVPATAITLDYAGLRTLDSVVRAHEVFDQQQFTIISQENHLYRAVFIARYYHIEAVAFAAKPVPVRQGFRVALREMLARVKAVLDLYILDTRPRHLGDPEVIELSARSGPTQIEDRRSSSRRLARLRTLG